MDKRVRKRKAIKKLKTIERQLKKLLEPIVQMDVRQIEEHNMKVIRKMFDLDVNEPMSYFEIKAKITGLYLKKQSNLV